MELWGNLLNLLKAKMFWARPYDWFHILFFVLSVAVGIILAVKFKNPTTNQVQKILLAVSVICIALEIYKQIVFCFSYDGEKIIFDYKWYIFPFQFCSTPMYVGLLAGLTKNRRLHNRLAAYLAGYALFAGLSVMVYPIDVLTDVIGVNIQTMVCHGSMISIAIFLLCSGYVETSFKTFLKALPVFVTCFFIAILLNEGAFRLGILEHGEFNMFYISPYGQPVIPILRLIQNNFPTPIPQLVYLVVFSLGAYLMLLGFKAINFVVQRLKRKI